MNYDFDQIVNRRNTSSAKWEWFDDDVLPMWVADMDFRSPEPVLAALQERVAHGVFGYTLPPEALKEAICRRMARLYNWTVQPDELLFVPGVVPGFNAAIRAFGEPGDEVLMSTPIYPPILNAPDNHRQIAKTVDLKLGRDGHLIYYDIDFEAFEAAITPRTHTFLLCHPHNPIGKSYTSDELARMAEICLRHNLVILSDEIHSELRLDGSQHTPTATLDPEIAQQCVTFISASKTFNLAGFHTGMAIVQNADLRQKIEKAKEGLTRFGTALGYEASLAAFTYGDEWLSQLLPYLTANRNYAVDFVQQELSGVYTTCPDATYLLWLDCREALPEQDPHTFFLEEARVALKDGANFGTAGKGFVRLNLACARARLAQGLAQMRDALQTAAG